MSLVTLRQVGHRLTRHLPWVVGGMAMLWFLIRVIPKPSRAAYPCQQAAFPLASAFVIGVVGALGIGWSCTKRWAPLPPWRIFQP